MSNLYKNFNFSVKKKAALVKTRALKIKKFKIRLPKNYLSNIKILNVKFTEINFTQINFSSPGKFSLKEQTFFAKRLSFLIKSGVPMLESMHVLRRQTKSKSEIDVFDKVISDVTNGQSLATSLGKFKGVFGNFAINIIRAGESSGTLMQNLNYLADELKKKELLRKKIMSALLYPAIITVATFGITGMLVVYIFPKIMPVFQSLKAELPISTRTVIWFSEMLRNYGFYIFLGIGFLSVALYFIIKKIPKARFIFHGFLLHFPFLGPIAKNYNLTNTTRTLGLLLKSGLSLTESLLITADTTENLQYRKAFEDISVGVIRGKTISDTINQVPNIFPDMVEHMISIGERSGNLSTSLIYLSEYYENEFDDLTKNLSSSIEPVLMIVMGFLVGFVAISIITPIYSITQHLTPK